MKTLAEKVVLITGAGSGIGRETALLLAEHGATVVLVGRRLAPLDAVAKEVRAQGGQAHVRSVDLEDGEAAAELGRWTLDQFGRVDVLVNNAGHSSPPPPSHHQQHLGGAPYSAAKAASRNLMGDINAELNDLGIRACTIVPAEVDTPILDNRPLVPDEKSRSTMMHPRDVADAILLCAVMPQRTVVEEIVLKPTTNRNINRDIEVARHEGEQVE